MERRRVSIDRASSRNVVTKDRSNSEPVKPEIKTKLRKSRRSKSDSDGLRDRYLVGLDMQDIEIFEQSKRNFASRSSEILTKSGYQILDDKQENNIAGERVEDEKYKLLMQKEKKGIRRVLSGIKSIFRIPPEDEDSD